MLNIVWFCDIGANKIKYQFEKVDVDLIVWMMRWCGFVPFSLEGGNFIKQKAEMYFLFYTMQQKTFLLNILFNYCETQFYRAVEMFFDKLYKAKPGDQNADDYSPAAFLADQVKQVTQQLKST